MGIENIMIAEKGFESCCSEPATPCLLYLCPECLPALLCCHAKTAEQAGMGSCCLNCLLISFCSFFGTCQVVRVRQSFVKNSNCRTTVFAWTASGPISVAAVWFWNIAQQSRQIKSICHQQENSTSRTTFVERSPISQNKFCPKVDEETIYILSKFVY